MSGSAEKNAARRRALRHGFAWVFAAVFCAVFAAVYGEFSHGVESKWMSRMYLFPLFCGALPFFALALCGVQRSCAWLWSAGVSALTVGSCVAGVLEIYGTASALTVVYRLAGAALCTAGAAAELWCILRKTQN